MPHPYKSINQSMFSYCWTWPWIGEHPRRYAQTCVAFVELWESKSMSLKYLSDFSLNFYSLNYNTLTWSGSEERWTSKYRSEWRQIHSEWSVQVSAVHACCGSTSIHIQFNKSVCIAPYRTSCLILICFCHLFLIIFYVLWVALVHLYERSASPLPP